MPSVVQFLDDLSLSGLVEEGLLESALAKVSTRAETEEVAAELIRQGLITEYQAKHVMRGNASRLVIDKYVLIEPIGQGGMGRVFKAVHRQMRRTVAIKVIVSPDSPDALRRNQRFEREAIATAKLDHPNIVSIYDVGQAGRLLYLVMQYVDGKQVRQLVKHEGPQSLAKTISIIRQAADGLAYAHDQGAIHRDIKPSNMMLTHAGVLKILDLGLARLIEDNSELTRIGATLGTVEWMAPEQAADASHVDHRVDIYSLGCTLYYLLTGRPVYRGDSPVTTLRLHSEGELPSLSSRRSDIPREMEQLFHAMIAKCPDERPGSMSEVSQRLKEIAQASHPFPERGNGFLVESVLGTEEAESTSSSQHYEKVLSDIEDVPPKPPMTLDRIIPNSRRSRPGSQKTLWSGILIAFVAAIVVWLVIVALVQ